MKSTATKKTGWAIALKPLSDILAVKPEGYYTAAEIAEETGVSATSIRQRLGVLREAGEIDAVRVRSRYTPVWCYKK